MNVFKKQSNSNIFFPLNSNETSSIWLPEHSCFSEIEEPIRKWILNPNSLTAQLKNHYQAPVIIKLLEQQCISPHESELNYLNYTKNQLSHCLIRRSLLLLKGIARIYACSLFPNTTHPLIKEYFEKFNHISLGQWLFDQPGLVRSAFEITYIHRSQLPPDVPYTQTEHVWGRRSIFTLEATLCFSVSEFFITSFD